MTGKKNNRDDFLETTKRCLKLRVGGRCSNPDCRVPTDAPSDERPEKVNSIGEAAHITAAAEGGPRYNKALKSDERVSITNGIWLCANCADKIDKDAQTYTVELLHNWKRKAEESAKREQGKKPDNSRIQAFCWYCLTNRKHNMKMRVHQLLQIVFFSDCSHNLHD